MENKPSSTDATEQRKLIELWKKNNVTSSSDPSVSNEGKCINSEAWREYCYGLVKQTVTNKPANILLSNLDLMLMEHYQHNLKPSLS